ncbi:MAG: zinc ABC transporter substrate-binding protein [bacterium]|nr:zinc ABC transporter substrate-binding protein [bacterium]
MRVDPRIYAAWLTSALVLLTPAAWAVEVVVTVHPLALLVDELAGDRAQVHVLVPPGASPHAFAPRPSDLVRTARADLFLQVGGGLDDWAGRLAQTAGDDIVVVSLLDLLGHEQAEHDHRVRHDVEADPHVWLDPIEVRDEVAPALATLLIATDPEGEAHYRARLSQLHGDLTRLDAEVRTSLAGDARSYVAFHNAWRHFAARYGLEELAVVQEAAGEQPTPRELANLVRDARAAGLRAILIEPQLDPRLAQTLGREFGGKTILVDPLGDPHDPERSTYGGLVRFNARAFRTALDAGHASSR